MRAFFYTKAKGSYKSKHWKVDLFVSKYSIWRKLCNYDKTFSPSAHNIFCSFSFPNKEIQKTSSRFAWEIISLEDKTNSQRVMSTAPRLSISVSFKLLFKDGRLEKKNRQMFCNSSHLNRNRKKQLCQCNCFIKSVWKYFSNVFLFHFCWQNNTSEWSRRIRKKLEILTYGLKFKRMATKTKGLSIVDAEGKDYM